MHHSQYLPTVCLLFARHAPLRHVLQQIPLASALSVPSSNRQHRNSLFKLDDDSISLGSKKAKRRVVTAARRIETQLVDLLAEQHQLELQIHVLEKPRKHAQEDELKRLKRRNLYVRDKVAVIRARSQAEAESISEREGNGVVGSGGFADVFLAHRLVLSTSSEDINAVEEREPVAVKVSRSASDNAALFQEADYILSLDKHPGFVRVQHREILDSGNAAIVMDLLGPSLEDLWWSLTAGAGGLSAPTVLRIADGMLSCLDSLLKEGIVHRDIQPANILMGRTGRSRQLPHLIDFGIASVVDTGGILGDQGVSFSNASDENQIPAHAFSGTPRFSSVSALQMHGGGARAADDLESLCYTLAFLLTGSSPWSEEAEERAMTNEQKDGAWKLSNLKADVDPPLLCGEKLSKSPAARIVGELLEHARSCEGGRPDYKECRLKVQKGLDILCEQSPDKALPPNLEWEDTITWSEESGTLVNTLYSSAVRV